MTKPYTVTKYFLFIAILISTVSYAQINKSKRNQLIENSKLPADINIKAPTPANEPPAESKPAKGRPDPSGAERKMADSSTRGVPFYRPAPDSAIRIGILLPFDQEATLAKIYGYMNDKELAKGDIYRLKESAREGIEFYQGLQYALAHTRSQQRIEFYTYDTQGSDSIVEELLKTPALLHCQIIIGPVSAAESRPVAAWCKKNGIINIQPFTASKSISTENPYLVRLMPTIDAHLQKEYEMVIDSFADRHIIVYTTKRDADMAAARQLDTLFHSYNALNTRKLNYTFFNSGDSSLPAAKRVLSYYIKADEPTVVLMTCYEEPLVNSTLRATKEGTVVFGMPTWIDGEQIRIDYMNHAQPYFTDNFYADTANAKVNEFRDTYLEAYNQHPTRYSYMGYDAMNYLSAIFDKYGFAIADGINKESYDGLGYSFHISPSLRMSRTSAQVVVNYYSNTAMRLFQVSDYKVHLIR